MLSTDERRAYLFGNIGLYNESFYTKLNSLSKFQQIIRAKVALLDSERSYNNISKWEMGLNPTMRMLRPVREDHDFVCKAKYEAAKRYIEVLESLLPENVKGSVSDDKLALPPIDIEIVKKRYKKIIETGFP